jgi:c-di-GMP-binding flagellar brake protein YcgR
MEKNNQDLNKRTHTRVAVDAYVSATLTTDATCAEKIFTTKDISPEGIFLVTKDKYPLGTILNLRIHTPSTLKSINVEAEVVRIAHDENSSATGMGLALINVPAAVREELLKHLYLAYHYVELDKTS